MIFRGSRAVRGLTTAATASTPNPILQHSSTPKPSSNAQHQSPGSDTEHEQKVFWQSNSQERDVRLIIRDGVAASNVAEGQGIHSSSGDDAITDIHNVPSSESTRSNLESATEAQPTWSFLVSPLMNLAFLQARQKHQAPKHRPSKLHSKLQQELAKNPFALALSTPVRICGLTRTSLPKYFLQDFKILAHPETGDPCFLPTSLTRKGKRLDRSGDDLGTIGGTTGYTLSSKIALSSMQSPVGGYYRDKGGKYQRAHHRLIPASIKSVKESMRVVGRLKWRPDMADFVLKLMRCRIIEHLIDLGNLKRGYLVGCADWEDAASKPQVAAFLWTGGDPNTENFSEPGEYSTLDLGMEGGLKGGEKKRKRKVPVYNLRTLLGREKLVELKQNFGNGMFDRELVALKHKNMTVELQSKFWRLQGYVAEHRRAPQGGGEESWDEYQDEEEDEDEEEHENKDQREKTKTTEEW